MRQEELSAMQVVPIRDSHKGKQRTRLATCSVTMTVYFLTNHNYMQLVKGNSHYSEQVYLSNANSIYYCFIYTSTYM